MDNLRQAQYLNAMGMAVWRRRTAKPASATADAEQAAVRVVVAHDTAVELGVGKAGELLANLLRAVKLEAGDFVLEQIQSSDELAASDIRTLAFVADAETSAQQIGLPTLQQMLDDRAHKKVAWDRLKPWVGRLR